MADDVQHLTAGSKLLLDAVWRHGPISRVQAATLIGFTRPAVTQIAQDLLDRELLTEQPAIKGLRGQPPRPLALNPSAGFTIGVNFSRTYLELGVVDFAGAFLGKATEPLSALTPEAIGTVIAKRLGPLISRHKLSRSRLLGVGIALPADFGVRGEALSHRFFPELTGSDLASRFDVGLDAPIFIENDGRACAIGERVLGIGARYQTFMLVHIGHGVGGGLIIQGRPYRGAWGNAGILGQYYPYGAPRPSGQDLIETLRGAGVEVSDFDDLETLPENSRSIVDQWVARAGEQLSGNLARVSRFFGPEAVILSGRLPPAILDALAAKIDMTAVLRGPMDDLPIAPLLASKLGASAGIVGAAALPILHKFLPTG